MFVVISNLPLEYDFVSKHHGRIRVLDYTCWISDRNIMASLSVALTDRIYSPLEFTISGI